VRASDGADYWQFVRRQGALVPGTATVANAGSGTAPAATATVFDDSSAIPE
jgi:hypothetical protein